MKIAICDDEVSCREEIAALLSEYADQSVNNAPEVIAFSNGDDLLSAAAKIGGYDIYILDIVMPGMNGIALGTRLRQLGFDGKIIYLTSSREYALDAFKSRPFDYILKPFDKAALRATLDEALESLHIQKRRSIIVRTQESSVKVNLDSILYAALERRAIVYHLIGGRKVESVQIRTSFPEAVQELLKDSRFVLCGASMIANLHHITEVETEALVFRTSCRAYLGKKACREIRSIWYDYCFDGEDNS